MENFCRVRAETIEPLAIFRPVTLKFCRQNGPRFGVQKRTPKWRPLIQSQFDLLVSGRLGPRFGVQKTDPKTGAVCRQNFCRRAKIVQVSIVSAGTRQKFCIPLGHWVPMVLQRREQLFSTPCERLCPHLFLNCSRTCVAINVRRAWRTSACGAAKPWKSSGMENFCRVRAETIEPLAIFRPVTLKFCRQNGPRFGVQKRTPKWRPLIQSQFDLLVSGRLGPVLGSRKRTPKRGPFVGKIFAVGRK